MLLHRSRCPSLCNGLVGLQPAHLDTTTTTSPTPVITRGGGTRVDARFTLN